MTAQAVAVKIKEHCSQFGTVENISLHGFPESSVFAIVYMSSPEEAARLRESVAGSNFAGGVVVPLVQTSTGLESRLGALVGRASREAFDYLQRLRDHPKLADLVAKLEMIEGELHEADIDRVLHLLLPPDK
ncbi:MAG TPA: RNA-binding protein [Burkholderiales bacterium]|nr:RNA-binding protein [Burkholderiales bacterium]